MRVIILTENGRVIFKRPVIRGHGSHVTSLHHLSKQEVIDSKDCFREAKWTEANIANISEVRSGLKCIAEVTERGKPGEFKGDCSQQQ